MATIWLGIVNVIKNLLLRTLSEKFFEWLLFWVVQMLVDSTKTTKDNEFYDKVKEIYEQSNRD